MPERIRNTGLKPVLIIGVIITAIGAWLVMSAKQPEIVAVSESGSENTRTELPSDSSFQQVPENSPSPIAANREIRTGEQAVVENRASSPFDLVADDDNAPQPAGQNNRLPIEQAQGTTHQSTASGPDQPPVPPMVVPDSFPASDAAKYYIPKDQRGPRQLGGPPPMDFAFGRENENDAGSGGFTPPPAPGQ